MDNLLPLFSLLEQLVKSAKIIIIFFIQNVYRYRLRLEFFRNRKQIKIKEYIGNEQVLKLSAFKRSLNYF